MTLQDIKDLFEVRYKLAAQNRGVKEYQFQAKIIFQLIKSALQDTQRELTPIVGEEDVSVTKDTAVYSLSSSFGTEKDDVKFVVGDSEYYPTKTSLEKINRKDDQTGQVDYYAIYYDGNTAKVKLYPTPSQSGTLTVPYYPKLLNYSPSGDSVDFSTEIPIPEEYLEYVVKQMLYKVLEDDKILRDLEVMKRSLLGSRVHSINDQMKYNYRGVD